MKGYILRRLLPYADTIVQRYCDGDSFEELAAHYKCGASTIRRFLLSQEIPLRAAGRRLKLDAYHAAVMNAFHAGADAKEIAQRFQVQPETVVRYLFAKRDR